LTATRRCFARSGGRARNGSARGPRRRL